VVTGAGIVLALLHRGEASCLVDAEPDTVLQGPQSAGEHPATGVLIDARTASWTGTDRFPVVIGSRGNNCLSGGTIQGEWPADTSWEVMHSTSAVTVTGSGATVEDLRVDGYGDSVRIVAGARDFLVRRAHLSDSRDDCIENDWLHSGEVEDSLLDGCYNAFSSRTYDGQEGVRDGSHRIWRIERSLVRLQPIPHPYEDRGLVPGTAGFFKWDPRGPQLSLHGNVFRADQPASTVGLDVPNDKIADCSDNVMVWLGEGDYPGKLPSCFRVTTDVEVWDQAVDHWEREFGSG
jgi:hypothetical protein